MAARRLRPVEGEVCWFCKQPADDDSWMGLGLLKSTNQPVFEGNYILYHEPCAVYSNGAGDVPPEGMDDASVLRFWAHGERCSGIGLRCQLCGLRGATTGCLYGPCQEFFHYPCARIRAVHGDLQFSLQCRALACMRHLHLLPRPAEEQFLGMWMEGGGSWNGRLARRAAMSWLPDYEEHMLSFNQRWAQLLNMQTAAERRAAEGSGGRRRGKGGRGGGRSGGGKRSSVGGEDDDPEFHIKSKRGGGGGGAAAGHHHQTTARPRGGDTAAAGTAAASAGGTGTSSGGGGTTLPAHDMEEGVHEQQQQQQQQLLLLKQQQQPRGQPGSSNAAAAARLGVSPEVLEAAQVLGGSGGLHSSGGVNNNLAGDSGQARALASLAPSPPVQQQHTWHKLATPSSGTRPLSSYQAVRAAAASGWRGGAPLSANGQQAAGITGRAGSERGRRGEPHDDGASSADSAQHSGAAPMAAAAAAAAAGGTVDGSGSGEAVNVPRAVAAVAAAAAALAAGAGEGGSGTAAYLRLERIRRAAAAGGLLPGWQDGAVKQQQEQLQLQHQEATDGGMPTTAARAAGGVPDAIKQEAEAAASLSGEDIGQLLTAVGCIGPGAIRRLRAAAVLAGALESAGLSVDDVERLGMALQHSAATSAAATAVGPGTGAAGTARESSSQISGMQLQGGPTPGSSTLPLSPRWQQQQQQLPSSRDSPRVLPADNPAVRVPPRAQHQPGGESTHVLVMLQQLLQQAAAAAPGGGASGAPPTTAATLQHAGLLGATTHQKGLTGGLDRPRLHVTPPLTLPSTVPAGVDGRPGGNYPYLSHPLPQLLSYAGCVDKLPKLRQGELRAAGLTAHPAVVATYVRQTPQKMLELQPWSVVVPGASMRLLQTAGVQASHVASQLYSMLHAANARNQHTTMLQDGGGACDGLPASGGYAGLPQDLPLRNVRSGIVPADDPRVELRGESCLVALQPLAAGTVLGPWRCYAMMQQEYSGLIHNAPPDWQAPPGVPRTAAWMLLLQRYTISVSVPPLVGDDPLSNELIDPCPKDKNRHMLYLTALGHGNMTALSNDTILDPHGALSAVDAPRLAPPNVGIVVLLVNGLPLPLLVTLRAAAAREELCWMYGEKYWDAWTKLRNVFAAEIAQGGGGRGQ